MEDTDIMSAETLSAIPEPTARGYYGPDGQPQFFHDAAMDRFAAVLVKLTQELWVVSERLDGLQRAVLAKGLLSASDLEAISQDAAVSVERDAALAVSYTHLTLPTILRV